MKLFLNSFILYIFFFCNPAFSDVFFKEYAIYTSGIKIGKLNWEVKIDYKNYSNNIKLESGGFLSTLYSFEGDYFSSGEVDNKTLNPKNYKHFWKTNKVKKEMSLLFNRNKLESLKQSPVENEQLRLDIFNINKTKDPLSSFLQIILGSNTSLVIDGRRFYKMNAEYDKDTKQTTVELTEYSNLWADHKRSDFEKITYEEDGGFLPSRIFIYFDGRVFSLK